MKPVNMLLMVFVESKMIAGGLTNDGFGVRTLEQSNWFCVTLNMPVLKMMLDCPLGLTSHL